MNECCCLCVSWVPKWQIYGTCADENSARFKCFVRGNSEPCDKFSIIEREDIEVITYSNVITVAGMITEVQHSLEQLNSGFIRLSTLLESLLKGMAEDETKS